MGVSLMSHPAKLCSTIKQACTQLLLAGLKVVQFCDKFVRVRPSLARRDLAAVFLYCTDCQSEAPLDIEIVRQDLNCNWDMIEPFVEGKPGGGRGAVKEIFR